MSEKVMVFKKKDFAFTDWKNERRVWVGHELMDIKNLLLNSSRLFYTDRASAEQDESLAQLIPYSILKHHELIFQYQRTKKGGESRLHDLWSIGVGGHINPEDGNDGGEAYYQAFQRELKEEVEVIGNSYDSVLGMIYDGTDPVGRVHFGIVHLLQFPELADLKAKDGALANCGFLPTPRIRREKERFENWSQMVIEHLI